MHSIILRPCAIAVLLLLAAAWPAAADDARHPSRLLGESALVYVEIAQPEKLIDVATDRKLWDALQQADGVERFLASDQFKQLRGAVEMFEARLGVKWEPALRDLVGGGIYVAIDPAIGGGVVIVKPRKPELLARLHDTFKELIESQAAAGGRDSPIKSRDYKGVTGWSFGPGEAHAVVGDVLAISNQADAVKGVVDRHRGDEKRSLADAGDFQQAQKSLPADRLGWGFARIALARLIPGFSSALEGRGDNPAAEFLVAGVLEALKTAPYAAFSLHGDTLPGDDTELRLRVALPYKPSAVAEKRKWFFPAEPEKAAYVPLKPKRTIQSISIHRDLSGMWLQRDKLFNDEVIAGLAQADSGLGLYFSGRDFGTEVLGALTPRMQFVAARQQFSSGEPLPAIKLPGFALVLEMKDPNDFAKHLLLGYQKVVGLYNIAGGMNGQPQMLLDSQEYQGVKIWYGKFLVEPNTDKQKAPLQFNFSPACATVGNRFVLSSTVALTRDLIDELKKPSATQVTSDTVAVVTDLTELATVLADNRDPLVAQTQVRDGGTKEQAAAQFNLLLDALRATRTQSLRLGGSGQQLWLEISAGLPKYEERK
jgi:hypothetical protein